MYKSKRVIFLIDMDAFFVSCEVNKRPELANKPVAIGTLTRKSIITSASYESRKLGIKTGMPIFKAQEICPDLIIIEPDFNEYTKQSEKIFNIITHKFTNHIEIASIDECYVDVTNIYKKYISVYELAKQMQQEIFKQTNITCSIGISDNKFMAKMAVGKNKPNGITLWKKEHIKTYLWPMELRQMYGIGDATFKKITQKFNISTIGELANIDIGDLVQLLGQAHAIKLKLAALGISDDTVNTNNNDFKSIGNEMTLDGPTTNREELISKLKQLCKRVCERASLRLLTGRTITLILRFYNKQQGEFNKALHHRHKTYSTTIHYYTNDYEKIVTTIINLFLENWNEIDSIDLIGVRLTNLKMSFFNVKQLEFDDYLNNVISTDTIGGLFANMYSNSNALMTGNKTDKTHNLNNDQRKFIESNKNHLSEEDIKNYWQNYYKN